MAHLNLAASWLPADKKRVSPPTSWKVPTPMFTPYVAPHKKPPPPKGSKRPRSYPSMVLEAVKTLTATAAHRWAGLVAVSRYIFKNYAVSDKARIAIKKAIERYVVKGILQRRKSSVALSKNLEKAKRAKKPKVAKRRVKKEKEDEEAKEEEEDDDKESEEEEEEEEDEKPRRGAKRKKPARTVVKKPAPKRAKKTSPPPPPPAKRRKVVGSPPMRGRKKKVEPLRARKVRPIKKGVAKNLDGELEAAAASTPSESAASSATTYQPKKIKWHYQEHKIWRPYARAADMELEVAYQDYLSHPTESSIRAVKSGQWKYSIDFAQMKQTNVDHPDHTTRDIKRVDGEE
eukprot:TRINITY_DN4822_c0_g1_i4.p1 TRINITY_DN4822_c0_g1~~TRINITY_DN4822_c0_g1_i4.p1  ORF type:complete len:345 (+),score=94.19 TRINITY_DN4822_c0_g1_i4:191-1225(+)